MPIAGRTRCSGIAWPTGGLGYVILDGTGAAEGSQSLNISGVGSMAMSGGGFAFLDVETQDAPFFGTSADNETIYVRFNGEMLMNKSEAQAGPDGLAPMFMQPKGDHGLDGGGPIVSSSYISSSSVDPVTRQVRAGSVYRQDYDVDPETGGYTTPGYFLIPGNGKSNRDNRNYFFYPFSGTPGELDEYGKPLTGNPFGYSGKEHNLPRTNGDIFRVGPPIDFVEFRVRFGHSDGRPYRLNWGSQVMYAQPFTLDLGTYSAAPGGLGGKDTDIKETDGCHFYYRNIQDFLQYQNDGWFTCRHHTQPQTHRDPGNPVNAGYTTGPAGDADSHIDSQLQTLTRWYFSSQRYASSYDPSQDNDQGPSFMEWDYFIGGKYNSLELTYDYVDAGGSSLGVIPGRKLATYAYELSFDGQSSPIGESITQYIKVTNDSGADNSFCFESRNNGNYTTRVWGLQGQAQTGDNGWSDPIFMPAGSSITFEVTETLHNLVANINGGWCISGTKAANIVPAVALGAGYGDSSNSACFTSLIVDPHSGNQTKINNFRGMPADRRVSGVNRNWYTDRSTSPV